LIDLKIGITFEAGRTGLKTKKRRAGAKLSAKESAFSELDQMVALPLSDMTVEMAQSMHARIFSGEDARGGKFPKMGAFSDSSKKYWVPPKSETSDRAPPTNRSEVVKGGKWHQWTVYPNYQAYLKAINEAGRARNFIKTGQLSQSMAVVIDGPARSRVVFTGSKVNITWKSFQTATGRTEPKMFVSRIQRSQQAWIAGGGMRSNKLLMAPNNAEIDQLLDSAALSALGAFADDLGSIKQSHRRRSGLGKSVRGSAKRVKRRSSITTGR